MPFVNVFDALLDIDLMEVDAVGIDMNMSLLIERRICPSFYSIVPYVLDREQCAYKSDFCQQLDINSVCNTDENVCRCRAAYYRYGDTCGMFDMFIISSIETNDSMIAKAVDSRCINDADCGGDAVCKGQRCQCNDRQRREQSVDLYGRRIDRCVFSMRR
jgi:hypothetical protein